MAGGIRAHALATDFIDDGAPTRGWPFSSRMRPRTLVRRRAAAAVLALALLSMVARSLAGGSLAATGALALSLVGRLMPANTAPERGVAGHERAGPVAEALSFGADELELAGHLA